MPLVNHLEAKYTVKITVGQSKTKVDAIVDTDLAFIVVKEAQITNAVDVTETANAVEGALYNPKSKYTGVEARTEICIYEGTKYPNIPSVGNIDNMPCIGRLNNGAFIHFAKTVPTSDNDVAAYLGMALSNGANEYGTQASASQSLMG